MQCSWSSKGMEWGKSASLYNYTWLNPINSLLITELSLIASHSQIVDSENELAMQKIINTVVPASKNNKSNFFYHSVICKITED